MRFYKIVDKKFDSFYNRLGIYDIEEKVNKLLILKEKINKILSSTNNKIIADILKYLIYKIDQKIYKIKVKEKEQPINPIDYQKMLGIGINVNWANFKKEIRLYTDKWPKDFKLMGFDNVRIRFNENTDLNHLKKVVYDCLKVGLVPVVAFSAKQFKLDSNEQNLQNAVNIWKKVAEILKDEPYKVSFDLIIEPGKNLTKKPEMLYKFYEKVVPIIRKTGGNNKRRIIFLAPNHLSDPEYLKSLTPIFKKLNDKYLMAEVHFLAAGPFRRTNKTGKRLTWNGSGSLEEKRKIENRLKIAVNWQKESGIRIWFGAWMPGNYNHTYDGGNNNYSVAEQIAFAKFFEGLLKKYNIPNDINADQQFYDIKNNCWRKDRLKVLKAIINTWK